MKKIRQIVTIMLSCALLFGVTLSANAANTARVTQWCTTCKATTPFTRCSMCYVYDKNNPYHCNVCGIQQNHPETGICPSH